MKWARLTRYQYICITMQLYIFHLSGTSTRNRISAPSYFEVKQINGFEEKCLKFAKVNSGK